ncbi:MAG: DUF502 domain-containing protein [Proteobacteria bacterium]|nr:DUF502 domain-containing protein [Pseudomonadota bacterium]
MDAVLKYVPQKYLPETYLNVRIPGLGLILALILILIVGFLARNIVGSKIVHWTDRIVNRIPLARIIYVAIKQLLQGVFLPQTRAFRRVVMVEFPRQGVYSIGFLTGVSKGEVQNKTAKKVVNVFVPTTPNPTSGFFIMVPEDEVIPLSMSVEDAFKLIISGGIVSPSECNSSSTR